MAIVLLVSLFIPSFPFIIFPFIEIDPAYIFFVEEKTVVISFPVNKALPAPVIIPAIRIMVHSKTGSWSNNK